MLKQRVNDCGELGLKFLHFEVIAIQRGTHLALKHITVAGSLNYGMSEICNIFQLYYNLNFPLLKYASNELSLCRA